MKSSIFLTLGILAAAHSIPIVIIKNKGVTAGEQTNPLTADSTSEDEYPRIHPILPLPKKEESNDSTSIDEYPQIHPILPVTRDKVPNVVNPATSAPPMKNKAPSVGLVSTGNEDDTPIIFKLEPGLSYNQAPPKTQAPVTQYENMAHNQETFMNQGVNLQNNYPIPVRMNPEQTITQYQGQYNYNPADTNVGGNQDVQIVQYQQTDIPQYSYEYQNQYPQQVQQNNEYILMVPASNYYQRPYNNHGYNRPYYTQSQDGYRPQETIYSGFGGLSRRPFGEIGSRIQSALHSLVRPFLG